MEQNPKSPGIEESLQQILKSKRFRDAAQLQALLKFIVENAVNDREDLLKERIIGMDVFGRRPDYETADDPIVRSRVGQLRKRLEQYYKSEESRGTPFKIVIPSGAYKPAFIFLPNHPEERQAEEPVPKASDDTKDERTVQAKAAAQTIASHRWRTRAVAAGAICTLALLISAGFAKMRPSKLDLFWAPLLERNKTVLICNGTVTAFRLSLAYWAKSEASLPPDELKQPGIKHEVPPLKPGEVMAAENLDAVPDGFMTPSDLAATLSIAMFLKSRQRSYDLRTGTNLPFVDLQASPAVLIGAYNNSWTMDLTQNLPFFFDRGGHIRERGGQQRFFVGKGHPDDAAADDYAIVTRVLDSKTNQPLVVLAGKRNCGTEAAGEFATNPEQWQQLGALSRNDLKTKNLELVLHILLDHCKATSTSIVALKTW